MRSMLIGVLLVATRVAWADWDEETFFAKVIPTYTVSVPSRGATADTVIGQLRPYRIRKGDTLIDLARYYSIGYNEIVEANPNIDPWLPTPGATILLPTEWILPCCSREGIVVNIPEMRLYFYQRVKGSSSVILHTYPVGLGRDDWRTPQGKFKIRGKTVNPQWNIPESIRAEHIKERDDPRTFIPGGAPDNPLGKYRIELTLPMYGIHGTDIPWGVGMQVSHGCVRLYPEDIERLFPIIPIGAPGEFTYQPIKVGTRGNAVYVEVHRDIYNRTPAPYSAAEAVLTRAGLLDRVDHDRLLEALVEMSGMPTRVSSDDPEPAPSTLSSPTLPNDRISHTHHTPARDG